MVGKLKFTAKLFDGKRHLTANFSSRQIFLPTNFENLPANLKKNGLRIHSIQLFGKGSLICLLVCLCCWW
jgi:hypothetical protein